MSAYFSITSSGRKPTPPAPRGMRTSVTSAVLLTVGLLQADAMNHKDTKAQSKELNLRVFVSLWFMTTSRSLLHSHPGSHPIANTDQSIYSPREPEPDPGTSPRVVDPTATAADCPTNIQ